MKRLLTLFVLIAPLFALAQQTVVDEEAGELVAHSLVNQGCGN